MRILQDSERLSVAAFSSVIVAPVIVASAQQLFAGPSSFVEMDMLRAESVQNSYAFGDSGALTDQRND